MKISLATIFPLCILLLISSCKNNDARDKNESKVTGAMASLAVAEAQTKDKTGSYALTLIELNESAEIIWDMENNPASSRASGKIYGYQIEFIDGPNGKADPASEFFMTAYPETSEAGVSTFLLGPDGNVWAKDLSGQPAGSFPEDPLAEGWKAK